MAEASDIGRQYARSGASLPVTPVGVDGRRHRLGRALQPPTRPPVEIIQDSARTAPEMQIARFPSHRAEEVLLVAFARQVRELHARAVRGESADDPALAD